MVEIIPFFDISFTLLILDLLWIIARSQEGANSANSSGLLGGAYCWFASKVKEQSLHTKLKGKLLRFCSTRLKLKAVHNPIGC